MNGHPATSNLELSPELAGKFCKECGAAVITNCPSCKSAIRGYYDVPGVVSLRPYDPPSFCEDCGTAFPWTAEKLRIASELTEELEDISDEDRKRIKESIHDITRDTPATSLAAVRLKKWLGKATDAVGTALWKITVEVATQAAKKTLLGGP
jgi:hypothetical protein